MSWDPRSQSCGPESETLSSSQSGLAPPFFRGEKYGTSWGGDTGLLHSPHSHFCRQLWAKAQLAPCVPLPLPSACLLWGLVGGRRSRGQGVSFMGQSIRICVTPRHLGRAHQPPRRTSIGSSLWFLTCACCLSVCQPLLSAGAKGAPGTRILKSHTVL